MALNQIVFNRMKIDKINLYIGLINNKIKAITYKTDAIQLPLQYLAVEPIAVNVIVEEPVIIVFDPIIIVADPVIIVADPVIIAEDPMNIVD